MSNPPGYGAAIKTGFNSAVGQLLAFTDADGTYPPERFPDLCRVALRDDADVVVGSRRSGERSEMPPLRRIGNFIWSNLVSAIGNTLYSTHTTWADKAAFEAWTRSDEFRRAHSRAGNETGGSLYLGHPKFEGFEVILSEGKSSAAA